MKKDKIIADTFNNYFTDKVETLKEKIDKNNVEDCSYQFFLSEFQLYL